MTVLAVPKGVTLSGEACIFFLDLLVALPLLPVLPEPPLLLRLVLLHLLARLPLIPLLLLADPPLLLGLLPPAAAPLALVPLLALLPLLLFPGEEENITSLCAPQTSTFTFRFLYVTQGYSIVDKRLCHQGKNKLNLAIFGWFLEGNLNLAIFGRSLASLDSNFLPKTTQIWQDSAQFPILFWFHLLS